MSIKENRGDDDKIMEDPNPTSKNKRN